MTELKCPGCRMSTLSDGLSVFNKEPGTLYCDRCDLALTESDLVED